MFDYDQTLPLDVKEVGYRDVDGLRIHDINYAPQVGGLLMSINITATGATKTYLRSSLLIVLLVLPIAVKAQGTTVPSPGGSNVRPPITRADLQIVKRAREILSSESKWNRADNRICPAEAKTVSLYCALQVATVELGGKAEHRGAALQEARFVIDEIAIDRNYEHRLMNYNNDPTTTFADIQEVLRITESLITLRLKANGITQ